VLNKSEDITARWRAAIRQQFSPECKPIWALYESGTVVFVPTVKYNVAEGIRDFSRRVLKMHGPEVTDTSDLDNEFAVVCIFHIFIQLYC
jgi:hypothetical protein